ncbi:MAG: hypothetical protein O2909_07540 [Chloroflexi bacterium]|nr:hypothetical protein [Chloroflexota bacterium]MDA1219279.1 hypothetical protein [Chloroflexota bacterium]
MRTLIISSIVPGQPDQVFKHVTAFGLHGEVDQAAMEQKYGQFLEREANTFKFLEDVGGGINWECVFDPPRQRMMKAIDSTWSDRLDRFEATEGGTLWTITWQLKSRGLLVFTQWLTFQIKTKRQVRAQMIQPVISHFSESG